MNSQLVVVERPVGVAASTPNSTALPKSCSLILPYTASTTLTRKASRKHNQHSSRKAQTSTTNVALATATASTTPSVLHNWSGINVIAKRSQIHTPETEAQLSTLIQQHPAGKVCVIGSALSYEKIASIPLADQSAILVDLRHMEGLRRITDSTAVFGPATTIDSVIRILGEHGRMLPCSPGVIGIQTLAGSISTGTHGQGLFQASYADIVVSLRVVLPSGEIAIVGGPSATQHPNLNLGGDDDDKLPLHAFVTSCGMLGCITEVEIRTAPRRIFSCTKLTCDLTDLLQSYDKWNDTVEFVKVWWFPETDQVHVWLTDPADETSAPYQDFIRSDKKKPVEADVASSALNDTVHLYCTAMSHDTKSSHPSSPSASSSPSITSVSALPSPPASPQPQPQALPSIPQPDGATSSIAPQFRTVRRFADARDLTGYQEQILTKGIPVPQVNCEIAVPISQWRGATLALREWAMNNKGRLHYPFIYRATGKSQAWLNPGYTEAVVYIGLLVYLAPDGTIRPDGLDTMREVQAILATFGGLPHWGKHFVPELYDFSRAFPKWTEFENLRASLDPNNRFLSPWLASVFGPRNKSIRPAIAASLSPHHQQYQHQPHQIALAARL
ncbi:FAD binding domain-containing protein [Powellomyces hirtus]|nr:FAD binding domain-containing protein [Powellomyces hirtus]